MKVIVPVIKQASDKQVITDHTELTPLLSLFVILLHINSKKYTPRWQMCHIKPF